MQVLFFMHVFTVSWTYVCTAWLCMSLDNAYHLLFLGACFSCGQDKESKFFKQFSTEFYRFKFKLVAEENVIAHVKGLVIILITISDVIIIIIR